MKLLRATETRAAPQAVISILEARRRREHFDIMVALSRRAPPQKNISILIARRRRGSTVKSASRKLEIHDLQLFFFNFKGGEINKKESFAK